MLPTKDKMNDEKKKGKKGKGRDLMQPVSCMIKKKLCVVQIIRDAREVHAARGAG